MHDKTNQIGDNLLGLDRGNDSSTNRLFYFDPMSSGDTESHSFLCGVKAWKLGTTLV